MKIACKTNSINTLTKDKIYDVIKGSWMMAVSSLKMILKMSSGIFMSIFTP